MSNITLYDTTLRDGAQGEGIHFSLADKLRIAQRLDAFGMHYIEGGWPGSNPKDAEFFARARSRKRAASVLTCFGMTRRPRIACDDDPQLAALVEAGCEVACIVGKTWTLHVHEALRVPLEENVAMVAESVEWLRQRGLSRVRPLLGGIDAWRARGYPLEAVRVDEADRIRLPEAVETR